MSTRTVTPLAADELPTGGEDGLGALATQRGNLPLESVDAAVAITGLVGRTVLTQVFRNPFDVALEATYVFPLPDRAAVTGLRMTADGRVVDAVLKERGRAREEYDAALAAGRRAAIAEEERPDVFTMRVGNIQPGERVSVALTMVGPLSYEDGEATYRLPLVVAPRYIPGTPLPDEGVGGGWAQDTDAVPDASRITPPVLLPGFPNPVRLSIGVDLDPAGLPLGDVRSSLHAVVREGEHLSIQPGERVNRDFVLRLGYGQPEESAHALTLTPDGGDSGEGTFRLTVLPPTATGRPRPRDVVLLLDRSGSMQGWKMVAARRAASRIVDTLTTVDRFAVLTFDDRVEHPATLPEGLIDATDRHRYRAVEHLARADARGGTELLRPLTMALDLLRGDERADRDRVLVLVTDGQVGNEDQILAGASGGLTGIRVHTVGIDQAVNAGFLGRLASVGGGRCELVESEDRLDEAMDRIHQRIATPVVTGLRLSADGLAVVADTLTPRRLPDLFTGAPLVVAGRYRTATNEDAAPGAVTVTGRTRDAQPWTARVPAVRRDEPALTVAWARSYLRDLEDAYAAGRGHDDQPIVAASLRFGVLCRFTAWLAVDTRVVTRDGKLHRVVQPVELPAGWELPSRDEPVLMARLASYAPMAAGAMPPPPVAPRPTPFAAPTVQARSATSASELAASQPVVESATDGRGIRPGPGRGRPAPVERGLVAEARAQVMAEVARLRQAESADEPARRELLADLGSRLAALVRHLDTAGCGPDVPEALRDLVAALDHDAPLHTPDLATLWERTLRTLTEFSRGPAPTPFWKRRPPS